MADADIKPRTFSEFVLPIIEAFVITAGPVRIINLNIDSRFQPRIQLEKEEPTIERMSTLCMVRTYQHPH